MCMADSRYACACKAKRALTRHLQAISWYSKGTASPGLSAQSDVMGFKIQASLHLMELRNKRLGLVHKLEDEDVLDVQYNKSVQ